MSKAKALDAIASARIPRMRRLITVLAIALLVAPPAPGQTQPDWKAIDEEAMRHFQALVRFDTSDPPGNEKPAADYLKSVLEKEGIAVQVFALEAHRPNIVARLKGSGTKRPLLI